MLDRRELLQTAAGVGISLAVGQLMPVVPTTTKQHPELPPQSASEQIRFVVLQNIRPGYGKPDTRFAERVQLCFVGVDGSFAQGLADDFRVCMDAATPTPEKPATRGRHWHLGPGGHLILERAVFFTRPPVDLDRIEIMAISALPYGAVCRATFKLLREREQTPPPVIAWQPPAAGVNGPVPYPCICDIAYFAGYPLPLPCGEAPERLLAVNRLDYEFGDSEWNAAALRGVQTIVAADDRMYQPHG